MKQFLTLSNRQQISRIIFCFALFFGGFVSCKKQDNPFGGNNDQSFYSADVLDKWLTLEIRLFKDATGIANGAFARPFAYSGITAYESIDPGVASFKRHYNGLAALPETSKFHRYHWPASVNASMAEFNRSFFTSANSKATDLSAIDSLENAISASFNWVGPEILDRSASFGKSIADAIFAWSQTDGFKEDNAMPYTIPVGPGLWQPTPPAFAAPSAAFWHNDRSIVDGSGDDAQPPAPIAYSEDPSSSFYKR